MFMRRGCLLGCGGWLIACVAIALLGWFLVIPRIGDALSDSLADGVSTMIADEINPLYSRTELQQGADVRFSFATINRSLQTTNDDGTVDAFQIRASGNQIVISADFNNQTFDVAFVPRVTESGTLELDLQDDDGWLERQVMGVISGGFEQAINSWLDRNDLRLVGVTLDGDSVILSVTGR